MGQLQAISRNQRNFVFRTLQCFRKTSHRRKNHALLEQVKKTYFSLSSYDGKSTEAAIMQTKKEFFSTVLNVNLQRSYVHGINSTHSSPRSWVLLGGPGTTIAWENKTFLTTVSNFNMQNNSYHGDPRLIGTKTSTFYKKRPKNLNLFHSSFLLLLRHYHSMYLLMLPFFR